MPDGRVLIAFDDGPLEPDPAWTRLDDTPNLVAEIEIHRGRQTELDITDTSTATVRLNDTQGLFDPGNTGSPYFGKMDGRQIMLQLRNPVTDEWVTQFRGFIDDWGIDLDPSQVISNIQIQCVDLFDFLGGIEMVPGLFGDRPPSPIGSEGSVWYEDGDVQTRITQLLTDAFGGGGTGATRTAAFAVVFTGNIDVPETIYNPTDSLLSAIRDAADAEFPTISNVYTDKLGRFVFHGREAKFDPDTVAADAGPGAWNFTRWLAGDGAAIAIDPTRAQIRPPHTWSRPRSRIRNAFLITPKGISQKDIPGQIITDAPSIAAYGYRPYSATELLVQKGTTTGNNRNDETLLYSTLLLAHYKDPQTRVETLTFLSMRPDDPRAAANWALICGADISDMVDIAIGYPGSPGLEANYFIEGSDMTISPLYGDDAPDGFDNVTLTLNVSQTIFSL